MRLKTLNLFLKSLVQPVFFNEEVYAEGLVMGMLVEEEFYVFQSLRFYTTEEKTRNCEL